MVYAEQKYGKLTLKQVMAPAIRLAREGYVLTWGEARDFKDDQYSGSFQSRGEFFSVTAIIISRAKFSASLTWRARWNGLPLSRMIFIMAL